MLFTARSTTQRATLRVLPRSMWLARRPHKILQIADTEPGPKRSTPVGRIPAAACKGCACGLKAFRPKEPATRKAPRHWVHHQRRRTPKFRAGQKPAGGQHSLRRARRAVTHLCLAIDQRRTLTKRARCLRLLYIAQPCCDLPTTDPSPLLEDHNWRVGLL